MSYQNGKSRSAIENLLIHLKFGKANEAGTKETICLYRKLFLIETLTHLIEENDHFVCGKIGLPTFYMSVEK